MLAISASIGTPVLGQSVIAESSTEAAQRFDESLATAGVSSTVAAILSPLQWAGIGLRPHFSYRYLYGDGIRSGPGREAKTSVHTVSPGILFTIGSRWTADYTASKTYYSSDDFEDRLAHNARVSGAAGYGNLSLALSYRFSDTSAPLAETATQTRQQTHGATLNAGYSLGTRTGLTSSVTYSERSSATTEGYSEWSFIEGIQYQLTPRLQTGLNVGFGIVDVESGADMSYVRPQAQINWQATDKLSLGLQSGWEERKFKDSGLSNRGNPTFSGSLAYRPFETTTLVLSGSRGTAVSYFRDQVTENLSWSLSLQQRLLQRFSLGITYSQRRAEYEATRTGIAVNREDDGDTLAFRLSTRVFERGNVGISYQTSNYDSNLADFAYDSNQFGAEFSYSF